jgi:hypothetical protein
MPVVSIHEASADDGDFASQSKTEKMRIEARGLSFRAADPGDRRLDLCPVDDRLNAALGGVSATHPSKPGVGHSAFEMRLHAMLAALETCFSEDARGRIHPAQEQQDQ